LDAAEFNGTLSRLTTLRLRRNIIANVSDLSLAALSTLPHLASFAVDGNPFMAPSASEQGGRAVMEAKDSIVRALKSLSDLVSVMLERSIGHDGCLERFGLPVSLFLNFVYVCVYCSLSSTDPTLEEWSVRDRD
jgi:hypothetical protein